MYGEKVEEAEELRLDLLDVKATTRHYSVSFAFIKETVAFFSLFHPISTTGLRILIHYLRMRIRIKSIQVQILFDFCMTLNYL
jgi:hypothetical protein